MNDVRLRYEVEQVSRRFARLAFRRRLAVGWGILALCAAGLLVASILSGTGVPRAAVLILISASLIWPIVLRLAGLPHRSAAWVAHRIEKQFPELDSRLLAAIEQRPDENTHQLGFLQRTLVNEAVEHAGVHPWAAVVAPGRLRLASLTNWSVFLCLAGLIVAMMFQNSRVPASQVGSWFGKSAAAAFDIRVEPEDTEVERGASLIVLARFGSTLPTDVELLYHDKDGSPRQMVMSRSLNDPLFAARIPAVTQNLTYAVRYSGEQTRWFKVGVFDYPDLKQADARLKFPQYTGQADKTIENTRRISAVEGTQATFVLHLNKPVAEAVLLPRVAKAVDGAPTTAPTPVKLLADPANPGVYTIDFDLKQSERYQLSLVDAEGRKNRTPAPELSINVLPNQPAQIQLTWPGRDIDASALQELNLRAQVRDDFGVQRIGVSYGLAGAEPQEAVLAENVAGNQRREVTQMVSLEKLSAEPDGLLSYHFWAEDVGADGTTRRVASDMFFAEVRPFEEIYRQGEQPAGGQQQQQQQQQQGGQNGQQAEELAEVQKQIISATWKIIRRETRATLTSQFVPDVKSVSEAQTEARERASALGERLTDARSKALLDGVLKHMTTAAEQLDKASGGPAIKELTPALSAEQAAYQALLKLRAREFEVTRNQRQQGGQQQRSSASSRRQRQLDQLDLTNEENRYETQRTANAPQEQDQQRETRQVLSRLRELAQRQEDLNRQMRELEAALQKANEQAQREEAERQLARLREQQQQQLRDTDELRDRMDQPENQERMADSRQQLEQTREDVRRSSESLEQGQLADAAAQGARAEEQFNRLRDEFRQDASGQFQEAMNQMRQDARKLDETQQQLSERLAEMNQPNAAGEPAQPRTLRDNGEREQVVSGLQDQRQQLDRLMDNMRQTVEQAEVPEPLLSKELYDTIRDASQQNTERALDASRQLLDRGFVSEARQAEADAGRGIRQVREGVERAAETVLGGQTDALRRARNELDELTRELNREIDNQQAQADGEPGATPTTNPADAQVASGQGAPEEQNGARRGQQPGAQRGQGEQDGQAQAGEGRGQQPGRGETAGQARANGGRGQQPGRGEQAARGAGRGRGQGRGNEQVADAQGQQPGDQPGGEGRGNRQGGRRGAGRGDQQADARGRGGLRGNANPGRGARGELQQLAGGGGGGGPEEAGPRRGPLTGEGFRDWSDRLRDVEEMVDDPDLRAQAAQIRERARTMRSDFNRHSLAPNQELVSSVLIKPLVELRNAVNQELLRREAGQALVPIDREPLPSQYADRIREYYERLGSGK